MTDKRKYVIVFIITSFIFFTAFWVSQLINDKKVEQVKNIQDKISVDILSLETQFDLMAQTSCNQIDSTILSGEIGSLADKLAYAESSNISKSEVQELKRYYSLLEIKDYLLMQKIKEKCKVNPVTILYFYSGEETCADCERQGYVLTHMRQTYPELRVYTFDYDLDLNAIKTIISINKIPKTLPALVINGEVHAGYQSVDSIEKTARLSTTTATSTKK